MFVVGGESLIDLVARSTFEQNGLPMDAHAGGSPYNCAMALARLGNRAGFLCPISSDAFGDLLLGPLDASGAELLLTERVSAPTTLAVVTRNEKGLPRYQFYREGTADRAFTRDGLIAALPDRVALMQTGGFMPIEPEDAAAWLDVIETALARGAVVSIDPNVRPTLLPDFAGYKARLGAFLDRAHLIKVSDEDLATLDDTLDIEAHARALLARPNCELVVVTLGEKGARAFTADAHATAPVYAPPVFGDTVGAGDSLMAGVLTALADRDTLAPGRLGALPAPALESVLRFGTVVAGLNCAHIGCHPPSRADVEGVLDHL